MNEIEKKFLEFCSTPSDINEHLPTLKNYYDQCDHVTEFGVRGCVSLHAALVSKASKVVAYDIANVAVPVLEKFKFICDSTLKVTIEETDFLFIDSLHTYNQLKQELELHYTKVKKYIGFHDTTMFGVNGEDGGLGLNQAINEFILAHPNWVKELVHTNNNGLTILKKTVK